MGQEKERRFKLKYIPDTSLMVKYDIEQGYLMFDGAKHLRIRISQREMTVLDYSLPQPEAILGFKTIKSKEIKSEFEYGIPLSEGIELMSSTNIKLKKIRYKTKFQGNTVDIDIFPSGMAWVEIEFEKPFTELPDYCGEEITGSEEFNNIAIALKNSKLQSC